MPETSTLAQYLAAPVDVRVEDLCEDQRCVRQDLQHHQGNAQRLSRTCPGVAREDVVRE